MGLVGRESLIAADDMWGLLVVMTMGVFFSIWLEQKYAWASKVSGAIIAYVINTLLSTFGMIAMLALNGHDKLVDLITCAVLDMQTSLLLEGITSPGEYPNSFMRVAMPLFALAYIIALPIIGVRIFKQTDLK